MTYDHPKIYIARSVAETSSIPPQSDEINSKVAKNAHSGEIRVQDVHATSIKVKVNYD